MTELVTNESVLTPEQCRRLDQMYVNWRQGLLQTKPESCSAVMKGA